MTSDKREYHVIGRGLAGWHAKGIHVSSSGGDLEDGVYWTGAKTTGYRHQAVPGALIYDASQADPDAFTAFILSGPMVDPALPADGVSRFLDHETAAAMAPYMSGPFQTLATAASDPGYSGLDTVGVGVYRSLLAQVPGIKIGTIGADGVITWDA